MIWAWALIGVLAVVTLGQAYLLVRADRALSVLAHSAARHRAEVLELEEQVRIHPPARGVYVVPPDFIGDGGGDADCRA